MGKSMRELREGGNLKTFIDPRIVEALGHPVRQHILAVFNERIASAKEIGQELGADVSTFYHHIELLEKLDCVERVRSRQVRGAAEHFFQAKRTLFFDDAQWEALPESLKWDVNVNSLQRLIEEAAVAVETGTFGAEKGTNVSWIAAAFDMRGWCEVADALNETLNRLASIHSRAAERLSKSDEEPIPATLGILSFKGPAAQPRGA